MSEAPLNDAEDAKLLTLARAARARTGAAEAVAVRDAMGRTYTAVSVALPSLQLSACQAVAGAVVSSAGAEVEAAVLVGDGDRLGDADRAVLADLGRHATVALARPDGTVVSQARVG